MRPSFCNFLKSYLTSTGSSPLSVHKRHTEVRWYISILQITKEKNQLIHPQQTRTAYYSLTVQENKTCNKHYKKTTKLYNQQYRKTNYATKSTHRSINNNILKFYLLWYSLLRSNKRVFVPCCCRSYIAYLLNYFKGGRGRDSTSTSSNWLNLCIGGGGDVETVDKRRDAADDRALN